DFAQRSAVSIHRKDGFCHDDDATLWFFASRPFQMTLQFAKMIVRKNANASPAQACAIDERSVSQFINHDDIVFPGDGGKSADRSSVTTIESNRGGRVLPFCDRALQNDMRRLRSRNQAGCPGADSELFDRVGRCGSQPFVGSQTEVIV